VPYLLPEVIDPPRISVCVSVPNERNHRLAFIGALDELQYYWNWEKDDTKSKARETAAVWREIIDEVSARLSAGEGCDMPVITDIQVNGCNLEVQYDDSGEWLVVGDLSGCVVSSGVQDLQDNNCQLQMDTGAGFQDVPGANYFKTTADCDITDTVGIVKDDANVVELLYLWNRQQVANAPEGGNLTFRAYDNSLNPVNIGQIQSRFSSKANTNSFISLLAHNGASDYRYARFGVGTGLLLDMDGNAGTSEGLAIQVLNQSFSNNVLMRAYIQATGRELFRVNANGRTFISSPISSPAGFTDALTLYGFANGVTPSIGFGPHIAFNADTSTQERPQARVRASWLTATDASRSGQLNLEAADYTGLSVGIRIAAIDGESAVGFHGAAAIERPVITGTSEYAALEDLLSKLDQYGLIDDQTNITPDTGSGSDMTKIVVTEVYRDFAQAYYGTFSSGSGYGTHAPTLGLVPGSNGFRMNRNYDDQRRLFRVRAKFEANFIVGQIVTLGIDLGSSFPRIIVESFIEPSYPDGVVYIFEGPAMIENTTTMGIGLWVARVADDYIPSSHGSITWQTLDLRFEGQPSLEADTWDTIYPFGTHRVVKWVDSVSAGEGWSEVPGGVQPPALIIEDQT